MKAAVSEATPRHAPASTRPRASLRPSASAPSLAGLPSASVIALRSPSAGAPLAGAVRTPLERSLGIDLGAVSVHGDAAARAAVAAAGARALAIGPRIFLGPRESGADLGVMAHEVAHVVQQQGGATVQRLGGDTGGLEREAVAAAGAVGRGEAFEVTGRTRTRPMFLFDGLRRAAGAVVGAIGDVIGTALGWVRERANAIPGYRLVSLILKRDPLTGEAVAFSTANLLRAMLELNPIGTVIRVALDRYGIVDRVADFVDRQMATLAGVFGSIGGAVMAFLRSLGPLDIVSPGAVIDRARRLIEEPIARMRAFIGTLTEGIATFVRDAVLRPLAELASRTRAWDLLCAVLGRNPITGEAVARNAETLIGGFMKLIGQEEVWENIKRGNAVARAWTWFQGTLAGVLAFVRELPQRFLDTLRSLSIGDLVAPMAAFGRIAGTFGAFVGQFLGWAGAQVLRLLEIIIEVVAPSILPYLKRAAGAFATIIRDPIRFVGNLVRAALTGFRQFGTNILDHLRTGLIGWLTGAMGGTGVHIPTALSLSEILKFVLSVLGLTWQAVRLRLVRVVGETAVAGLEQGFDMVRRLVTEGPAAAWQMIVEAVGNLRDMVVEQVMGFVRSRIVQAAITRLIASLNPAGAFIQAILAIYNTIMFLVERLQQIAQVAAGVIDSIAAIAGGVITQAANAVERTAARLLPVVIAFLARLIGLGNVGEVVTRFLDRVRRPIERALERLVDWIVAQARRLGRAVVGGVRGAVARVTNWWAARRAFTARDGSRHTLHFQGQGAAAVPTVSTVPTPVVDFLARVAPAVSASTDATAKADLAAAQALLSGGLRSRLRTLNARGSAAPSAEDVARLNNDLLQLSNLLVSLIPFDPRSVAATPTSLPVRVDDLIKLKQNNQVAVVTSISHQTIGARSQAAGQVHQMVNWRVLRQRGRSGAGGVRTADFVRDWGRLYERYVEHPRELYLGPTPGRNSPIGQQVKQRMERQGKYDPRTGMIRYSGDARGRPLPPGQPARSVREDNCDMGHLVDAVAWWNSNGRLTFPQSPEVLRFMNDPDNYELEPSGANRARGAALGASGVIYRPPVG